MTGYDRNKSCLVHFLYGGIADHFVIPGARWLYNGGITPVENEGRFLKPLVGAGCLLTRWKAAFSRVERSRTPPDLPEQATFHPVSRLPAKASGVRKRLPFSQCKRPDVTPPLYSHLAREIVFVWVHSVSSHLHTDRDSDQCCIVW